MGVSIAALGTWIAGAAEGTAAVVGADAAVAGTSVVGTAAAGTAGVAGTAAATGAGAGLLGTVGTAAATAAASAGVQSLLSPKPPKVPGVTPMPDLNSPEAQLARQRSIAEQMARSGRAATMLSQPSGTLGG